MPPSAQSHSRSHSLLLLQKLLNLRDGSSPLTLALDTLEQSAAPLIREFITRAKIAKSKVIFLSFATLKKPRDADVLVKGRGKNLAALRAELLSHYPRADDTTGKTKIKPSQRTLIVIDSLNELATAAPHALTSFLSFVLAPAVSLLAVYHADVPLLLPRALVSEYEPHPLTTLTHLATAILRLASLPQEVARQRARDRSLQEPDWGLAEAREGVLVGLESDGGADRRAAVLDMELRRRSGRAVRERFVLYPSSGGAPSRVALLAEHAAFAPADGQGGAFVPEGEGAPESTFSLGLTEKQRRDREGIVLPYFDAQTDIGAGEGGRILYEMGREDDFDDEEDEI